MSRGADPDKIKSLQQQIATQANSIESQQRSMTLLSKRFCEVSDDFRFITELMQEFLRGDKQLGSIATLLYDRLLDKLGAFRGSITVYKSYDEQELFQELGISPTVDKKEFLQIRREDIQKIALDHKAYLKREVIGFQAFRMRDGHGGMVDAPHPFYAQSTTIYDLVSKSITISNDTALLEAGEQDKAQKNDTGAYLNYGIDKNNGNRLVHMHFAFHDRTDFTKVQIVSLFRNFVSALQLIVELASKNNELARLSTLDPLTGSGNRRQMDQVIGLLIEYTHRYHDFFSVALIDMDDFKQINDRFGHMLGDYVLQILVSDLKRFSRDNDTVFRFGGDEFIVVYPHTSTEGALAHLRRANEAFIHHNFHLFGDAAAELSSVTFSAGILTVDSTNTSDYLDILQEVDTLLYAAKKFLHEGLRKEAIAVRQDGKIVIKGF